MVDEMVPKNPVGNYAISSISLPGAIALGGAMGICVGSSIFALMLVITSVLAAQFGAGAMLIVSGLFSSGVIKTFAIFVGMFMLIGILTGLGTGLLYNFVLSKLVPVRLRLKEVI